MRKKKIPKASKKRLAVFGTLSIIIIFYFLFILGFYVYKIYNLQEEKKSLEDNYTSLKTEEKELRNEIEKLQDPDYIARYARENYSYSKDGEYIIKLTKENKEEEETDEGFNVDYSIYMYGSIIVLFLIIVHVLRKKKA
jgi:cell division protein DivIC